MVALQIISKILASKDSSILKKNNLTVDYFKEYQDEIQFIIDHENKYGVVPDKATFLAKFDIDLVDVAESDKFLVDAIREEYLFYKSVPIIQKAAELLKVDSNEYIRYMSSAIKELQPTYNIGGIDIISEAHKRLEQFKERKARKNDWYFTTGFEELDEVIHGLQRGEELVVIVARINQGKSWVLEKICTHIWEIGFNVGYISPEMGDVSIGYRFDTLHSNYSNRGLMWATEAVSEKEYEKYISDLSKQEHKFMVATPKEFGGSVTVSQLRNWVETLKLDVLAIDGIKYISDERYKRGDNLTTSLTNISEDLMALSVEMKIPVLVVIQANRGGVAQDDDDGAPDLDKIKDSDGPGANASKVFSIRQMKDNVLRLEGKKDRFGSVGWKLNYQWDIDKGDFVFVPAEDDAEPKQKTEKRVRETKKQYKDKKDVF